MTENQERMLHTKLALIRSSFGTVEKTGFNDGTGQGYAFVEASHIADRFLKLCGEQGITMLCIAGEISDIRPTASGKQTVYTIRTIWKITDAVTGEEETVEAFGQGADNADKALPKAQTNAMKYAILLLLQRAGDDPEKDTKVDEREAEGRQARAEERRQARRAARQGEDKPFAPVPQTAPVPQGVERPADVERPAQLASDAKKRAIRAKGRELGLDDAKLKAMATFLVGEKSSKEWTDREADKILGKLDDVDTVSMFRDDVVATGEAVPA